ncbi:methyltransferase domain-containing protein [Candidatus Desantisbacteria bacterium]|nr:methyltransferase domain-containing protein [Candidatus Desantisbacteria bacterium]
MPCKIQKSLNIHRALKPSKVKLYVKKNVNHDMKNMSKKKFKENITCFIIIIIALSYLIVNCFSQQINESLAASNKFNSIELWVREYEAPERESWQRPYEVIKNINLNEGDIIADIGAGTGYFTRRFAEKVGDKGKALGLDIEPSMVEYMKNYAQKLKLKNYIPLLIRPNDPQLDNNSIDIIFMCNTYHYIEERTSYIKKLSKSLKKDGRIIIIDYRKDYYKKSIPAGPYSYTIKNELSEEIVKKEFQEAGYILNRSLDFLPYQYFLEFTKCSCDC